MRDAAKKEGHIAVVISCPTCRMHVRDRRENRAENMKERMRKRINENSVSERG